MFVREIMTKEVEVIGKDASVQEAAIMMRKGNYGALPVEFNDRLVGMLTDRDIALRLVGEGKDPSRTRVGEIMTEGVTWCFEDQSIDEVSENMAFTAHRRIPVMNRDKRLIGILSISDLATHETPRSRTHEVLREVCH